MSLTPVSQNEAVEACRALSLGGLEWRLPTISELRTLIRGCPATETGAVCGVTDACLGVECSGTECNVCKSEKEPNNGCYSDLEGFCGHVWSSSFTPDGSFIWTADFKSGNVTAGFQNQNFSAVCVGK